MKVIKLEDLTNYITINLGISETFLASLIGVKPSDISEEKDLLFKDIHMNKIGKRIGNLFYVVHHYVNLAVSKEVILQCLRDPCFEDINENMDSVTSAIQQDKYNGNTLLIISELAFSQHLSKIESRDDVFQVVQKLL